MFRGIGWPCSVSFTLTFFFDVTSLSAVALSCGFGGTSFSDVPEGFPAFVVFALSGGFADDCDGLLGSGEGCSVCSFLHAVRNKPATIDRLTTTNNANIRPTRVKNLFVVCMECLLGVDAKQNSYRFHDVAPSELCAA